MRHTKIDSYLPWSEKLDSLTGNPRLWADALSMFIAMWCDCSQRETDGYITAHRIAQLTPLRRTRKTTLNVLVRCHLIDKQGDIYQLVDYLRYNESKSRIALKTRAKTEKQRRWRAKGKVAVDAVVDGLVDGLQDGPEKQLLLKDLRINNTSTSNLKPKKKNEKKKKGTSDIEQVFSLWQVVHKHPHAKLDKKRQARIKARLGEGYTVDELCNAIRGAKHDTWLMGKNPDGKIYDGLQTILREAETVDRYLSVYQEHGGTKKSNGSAMSFIDDKGIVWTWDKADGVYRNAEGRIHYGNK